MKDQAYCLIDLQNLYMLRRGKGQKFFAGLPSVKKFLAFCYSFCRYVNAGAMFNLCI